MKFLANENIPLTSILVLRARGYETVSISEIMSGACDKDVIQYAIQNDLIILTFDRDYGELIFRFGQQLSSGVVYFRLSPMAPEDCGNLLIQQILQENLQLETYFTVIEKDGIRQRKLPNLTSK